MPPPTYDSIYRANETPVLWPDNETWLTCSNKSFGTCNKTQGNEPWHVRPPAPPPPPTPPPPGSTRAAKGENVFCTGITVAFTAGKWVHTDCQATSLVSLVCASLRKLGNDCSCTCLTRSGGRHSALKEAEKPVWPRLSTPVTAQWRGDVCSQSLGDLKKHAASSED